MLGFTRAVLLALAMLLSSAQLSPAQPLATIRIGVLPTDSTGQAYYAQELGMFKRAGISAELIRLQGGPAVAAAVASGAVDIGAASIVNLAVAHLHGLPFVLLAPAGIYSNRTATIGLVVPRASTVRNARDLNGKTIAVDALSSLSTIGTQVWVDRNGGDAKSLKFVELGFGQMGAALAAGHIDAAFIPEPTLDNVLADEGRLLARPLDAVANEFALGAWFATADYVKNHPDIVARFDGAMAESSDWANRNTAASGQILEKYTSIALSAKTPRLRYSGSFETAPIQPLIDTAAKYGLLDRPFPANELYATAPGR